MVEINFLCVHKKLRSKRVAPVLIREITRRVHLEGIFQAVYTAGVVLPKPVGTCRYWHRSLNPRKLIEVKFSHLSRNMTMQRTMKLYRLPETPKTPGLRPMEHKDISAVHKLLTEYLKHFHLTPIMSREEVEHWFLPQENIIDTFVVESAQGEVTDFLSFYTLPSTIMNHPTHKSLKAAYSFYNVHTKTPLIDLMSDALILAKSKGFDVFNALDLMENKTFLEKLKFGIGDGNLQYYLYNWKCPSMAPEKVRALWGPASMWDGVSSPGSPQGDERAVGAGHCLFALQGSLGSCPRAATSLPCEHKGLPSHTPAPRPAAVCCKAALSNVNPVTPRAPLHRPQCVCTGVALGKSTHLPRPILHLHWCSTGVVQGP
uniref:Glycylpeptide N-tetradecanoyltransferase n=1 Tax=Anas platyrhynchos TaxID=8839 RepID=A0A8B9SHF1_ANAPL